MRRHPYQCNASVEASGPHDFAVRLHAFVCGTSGVHRIPHLNVRDDRETPLMERTGRVGLLKVFLGRWEEENIEKSGGYFRVAVDDSNSNFEVIVRFFPMYQKDSAICRVDISRDENILSPSALTSSIRKKRLSLFKQRDCKLPGRNQLCFCGSGRRFKHCHGRLLDGVEPFSTERVKAISLDRQRQQGLGKPIHSFALKQGRGVIVGRSIMIGQWITFTDFLLNYFSERVGRQWISSEMERGVEGHIIGQWAAAMRQSSKKDGPRGQVVKGKVNNGFRSILSTAYNLYLIEHHYEQYDEHLLERMINRLRVPNGFFSTLSEMNAAAVFLKAGFFLKYEDDRRNGHHAEFIATAPNSNRRFSVEVKTRTGDLNADRDAILQVKIKNKLSQALKKDLPWTRVVFIDINLPDVMVDGPDDARTNELLSQVEEAEKTLKIRGKPAPSAYLFLVNQPFHHNYDSLDGLPLVGPIGFRLPTFQPKPPVTFRQMVVARENHPEMYLLIESMKRHVEIPSTFDGQAPEFTFIPVEHPRWLIGNEYVVPDFEGREVLARLTSASASIEGKTMHGVFNHGGCHFVASCPMTEAEVAVYQRSPETFFGVIQSVGQTVSSAYELAEFFYEVYKDTSKEKLLEFLKDHPLLHIVQSWSQKDLAIFVCEQWALSTKTDDKIS